MSTPEEDSDLSRLPGCALLGLLITLAGRRGVVEELYRRFARHLICFGRRGWGRFLDVEGSVQDVFVELLEAGRVVVPRCDHRDCEATAGAFLGRVLNRVIQRALRQRRDVPFGDALELQPDPRGPQAGRGASRPEAENPVVRAIHRILNEPGFLSQGELEILLLLLECHDPDDPNKKTPPEKLHAVTGKLGITPIAFRQRKHRLIEKLKRRFRRDPEVRRWLEGQEEPEGSGQEGGDEGSEQGGE